MNINMEYYRVFYYVASLGSMTAAAEKLGTDQPNVSRIIKRMEDESGFSLFLRSGKKLVLTTEGGKIYSMIKGSVERIIDTERQIECTRDYRNRNVTIASSGIAMHYIEEIIRDKKRFYPNLSLKLHCLTTTEVLKLLDEEAVDIGFCVLSDDIPSQFNATVIHTFKDYITVGPEYSYLTEKPHSIHDFADIDFVSLPPHTQSYNFFEKFYKEHNFTPRIRLEVTRSDHAALMILNNWGIGFLPKFVVDRASANLPLQTVDLIEQIPERHVYMITKKGHALSKTTKAMASLFAANQTTSPL